ncbi:hypothetical protein GCM10022252_76160 [Streptosporangium oxazolinicum]|uniref:Uncharacterized protein n=1 Tax=Streptosporangium oxazolinicum TaxID=909287 RepID=A0ABP8BL22_9ACTN
MKGGQEFALYITVVTVALSIALALLCQERRRAAVLRRELARTRARLETLTGILAPIPEQLLAGKRPRLSPQDLATIAVLVEHDGPEGEQLLALEAAFHPNPNRQH